MRRRALITGGSRGIGAACAVKLAEDGYDVVVNYNKDKTSADNIAALTGGRALKADVSDFYAVTRMLEESGSLDTLVCCAGIAHYGLFTDITDSEWRRVFDVNVGGVINCCRAAIPEMVRAKSGCIITVSSIWGISGASCEAVYSSSKAAVIGLTKALAKELGPSGIRVNCVAPGIIDTAMLSALTEADIDSLRVSTPLGRIGRPEDIAELIGFLASDASGFITGQVISPNGGFVI